MTTKQPAMTPIFGTLICLADTSIPAILFHTLLGNLLLVVVLGVQVIGIDEVQFFDIGIVDV